MKSKLVLLTVLLGAAVVADGAAGQAASPAGGLVHLMEPIRYLDTRNEGPPSIGPFGMPSIGYVYVLGATTGGSATIYPCGGTPGPDPSLLFDAGEVVYTKSASPTPQCIVSSTPVHFIADSLGYVGTVPAADGLQYVALPSPLIVDQGTEGSGERRFDLGTVPPAAKAAVMLMEALDPTQPGYATAYPCTYRPPTVDVSWTNHRAAGIAYTPLVPGSSEMCSFTFGTTRLRVTLLGYLQNDGPDPLSLPPTLRYPVQDVAAPGLRAVTPVRLVDTRQPTTSSAGAKLPAGSIFELSVRDQVAASTTAVALNVTVTEPDGEGFLTVFPCDQPLPKASNLNYVGGETVPNLVNVKLSITDTVCFYSNRSTHLVVDLMGTFERGGGAGPQSVPPGRLLDTRKPIGVATIGKLSAGQTMVLQVAGRGGVPATDVAAATLNVTVTEPDGGGFVTAYPCDRDRPTASNLNFVAGQTVPNLVTVRLSYAGTLCLFTSATTHLVADIAAWYSVDVSQGYRELPPARILDTREPIGVPTIGMLGGGEILTLQVAGRGGVPASGALAVTMNVTVTEPQAAGFVTIYPCDADRPEASNLNFSAGETVPNLVTAKLSAAGTVCLFAQRTTHLVADVAGYFTDVPEALRVESVTPQT